MEQFSLEKYLENPNRKVVTRNGRSVRIICTDRKWIDATHIIALVTMDNGIEVAASYSNEGRGTFGQGQDNDPGDLFFAPIKKERWVNMYKTRSGSVQIGQFYRSKEKAEMGRKDSNYISTAKIEWEE